MHMADPLDRIAFGQLADLTQKRRNDLAKDLANRIANAVAQTFKG